MSEKQSATNTSVEPTTNVPKKRGRKSKKEIELEKAKLEDQTQFLANNINVIIEESYNKEINTNKHHLLFNDLLYNLFKRKKFITSVII